MFISLKLTHIYSKASIIRGIIIRKSTVPEIDNSNNLIIHKMYLKHKQSLVLNNRCSKIYMILQSRIFFFLFIGGV